MGTTVILMPSFEFYVLNEYYNGYLKNNEIGEGSISDRLGEFPAHNSLILPQPHREGRKERPNIDPIVMLKLLVLQQWYGLSDPELEPR